MSYPCQNIGYSPKKQEKAHGLNLREKFPKENSSQYLQVPAEDHGTVRKHRNSPSLTTANSREESHPGPSDLVRRAILITPPTTLETSESSYETLVMRQSLPCMLAFRTNTTSDILPCPGPSSKPGSGHHISRLTLSRLR